MVVLLAILLCAGLACAKAEKWILIDLSQQALYCYEGDKVVFSTNISTGKSGDETPTGNFQVFTKMRVGRAKKEYGGMKLNYCLAFNGDIMIHEFKSVPKRPASHGCVRTPKGKGHWVYDWCPRGTSVIVQT